MAKAQVTISSKYRTCMDYKPFKNWSGKDESTFLEYFSYSTHPESELLAAKR